MEAIELMDLFDFCWFEMEIFRKQPSLLQASSSDQNPGVQIQEEASRQEILRVPTIIRRSMSEQISFKISSDSAFSFSPDSVLCPPKLQTILSVKEIIQENEEISAPGSPEIGNSQKKGRDKRGEKGDRSKSLSELEFEELKGFMDLGFVFSEEDKDSSLVSIIPGLQRLGKNREKEDEEEKNNNNNSLVNCEAKVSRPYLSEAWGVLERKRKENPLVNWRIPAIGNEIDMKDNLRWWAHTVASSVR